MDHAEWMEHHLASMRRYREGKKPRKGDLPIPDSLSDFQKRVVDILGIVGCGIYNAPINHDKIDWDWGGGVSVIWGREMATWDFNQLTTLVLLAHAARIRVQIEGLSKGYLRVSFWQRQAEGEISRRHPSMAEVVKAFEDSLPQDHRIRFKEIEAEAPQTKC
jgi:hypothetical protein